MELAETGELYCAEHLRLAAQQSRAQQKADQPFIKQTCNGTNKKGKPCKSKGEAPRNVKFYCDAHVDQASEEESSADEEEG